MFDMGVLLKPGTLMNMGLNVTILLFHILFLACHAYFVCRPIAHCLAISNYFGVSTSRGCAHIESPYLLICLAHQRPMPRFLANILDHILNCFVILLLVNLKPETFTLIYNSCSQKRCFFSNTSSKDQSVDCTLQFDVVAADEAKDAVNEDIER